MDDPRQSRDRGVTVTWFDLDQPIDDIRACAALLSPSERDRVDRQSDAVEKNRMIVRLARRRTIVGDLCSVAPKDLLCRVGPFGKPYVMSRDGEVEFSASHSGDVGVLALIRGRRVGVDVEARTGFDDSPRLARWLTTEVEASRINAQPATERAESLLHLWTRTEALVKATGEGLGEGVHFLRTLPSSAPRTGGFTTVEHHGSWRLYTLESPRVDIVASLAVEELSRDETINVNSRSFEPNAS